MAIQAISSYSATLFKENVFEVGVGIVSSYTEKQTDDFMMGKIYLFSLIAQATSAFFRSWTVHHLAKGTFPGNRVVHAATHPVLSSLFTVSVMGSSKATGRFGYEKTEKALSFLAIAPDLITVGGVMRATKMELSHAALLSGANSCYQIYRTSLNVGGYFNTKSQSTEIDEPIKYDYFRNIDGGKWPFQESETTENFWASYENELKEAREERTRNSDRNFEEFLRLIGQMSRKTGDNLPFATLRIKDHSDARKGCANELVQALECPLTYAETIRCGLDAKFRTR